MRVESFLQRLQHLPLFEDQIVHIEPLARQPAQYQEVSGGIRPEIQVILDRLGIEQLYSHQATAIDAIHQGRNVVIVTSTASGKTLCYTIPVIEAILENSRTTKLFLYPTKALAQDQLRGLAQFQDEASGIEFMAGTYDGDTPATLRRKIRDGSHMILTNPDMLHQGILPQHSRWNRFFANLRYIVIDEVHAYRGVFGSHLANVMRRLRRICRHYGAAPPVV